MTWDMALSPSASSRVLQPQDSGLAEFVLPGPLAFQGQRWPTPPLPLHASILFSMNSPLSTHFTLQLHSTWELPVPVPCHCFPSFSVLCLALPSPEGKLCGHRVSLFHPHYLEGSLAHGDAARDIRHLGCLQPPRLPPPCPRPSLSSIAGLCSTMPRVYGPSYNGLERGPQPSSLQSWCHHSQTGGDARSLDLGRAGLELRPAVPQPGPPHGPSDFSECTGTGGTCLCFPDRSSGCRLWL